MADDYLRGDDTLINKINSLIGWQNTKAAASGFLAGLGEGITLPVAVPVNMALVIYVQVTMITSIAHMAGYDFQDDGVKTLVYACLCGNAAKDIFKKVGIKLGTKLTEESAIKKDFCRSHRLGELLVVPWIVFLQIQSKTLQGTRFLQ